MEPVSVYVGDQFEAALVEGALKEHGINCLKQSEHGAGFVLRAGAMFESFHIYVAKEDEARAREIIERFEISEIADDDGANSADED